MLRIDDVASDIPPLFMADYQLTPDYPVCPQCQVLFWQRVWIPIGGWRPQADGVGFSIPIENKAALDSSKLIGRPKLLSCNRKPIYLLEIDKKVLEKS